MKSLPWFAIGAILLGSSVGRGESVQLLVSHSH
jgi:hypothetical protein